MIKYSPRFSYSFSSCRLCIDEDSIRQSAAISSRRLTSKHFITQRSRSMEFPGQMFYIITTTLFSLLSLITIIFTVTAIVTIRSHWHTKFRSVANLLTCNSSAALLFYAISISIQIPLIAQANPLVWYGANSIICRFFAFLVVCATSVKTYSYMVQAVTQYFITILHQRRSLQTLRSTWSMIITSWLVSVVIAVGLLISPTAYQYEPESHMCILTTKDTLSCSMAIVVIFLVALSTVIVLYGIILYRTIQHSRQHPMGAKALQIKRNIKVFKRVLLFTNVLIVSGTPYVLSVILNAAGVRLWPLYSIAVLFISFGAAVESMAVLLLNDQMRKILFDRFRQDQTKEEASWINTIAGKNNQIHPNVHQGDTV